MAAAVAAYVLHRHDWSESSLILDLWTREHGRIAAVAKGAKRPHSQMRCVLLPFQRLNVLLGGRPASRRKATTATTTAITAGPSAEAVEAPPELHLLRSAEWAGGGAMPTGAALLAGFHLNELLLRGLARHDPHPGLFEVYAATLPRLSSHDEAQTAAALRAFELWLLRESGVLPELDRVTLTQQPVRTDVFHGLHPERGVHTLPNGAAGLGGATLLALQSALNSFDLGALQQTCQGALPVLRTQLRHLLHYHLGTSALRTRALMVEVQKLTDLP